jgi:hypothetical protein
MEAVLKVLYVILRFAVYGNLFLPVQAGNEPVPA